ncbi:MAG: energy transducer TonB [Bacteroidales bacterium]|nr:energy transducer TonB [Bacteroidales bacterium]
MKRLFLIMFLAFLSVNAYSQSDDEVYSLVEEAAQFPGGQEEMMKFIQDNRQYPDEAKSQNLHGRVIVSFIVEKDGSLSNVKVMRSLGSGCDEEAVRVINSMPMWKPGKNSGKEVRTKMLVPITF